VGGIGDMGTSIQFIMGYPLVALVALNFARRHLDRKGYWKRPELAPS
jgi:hypothetical protein